MKTLEEILREVCKATESRIVLFVVDGLGGLPVDGKTELETASTPNLDALVAKSVCGLADPILPGITPGSGPGHLGLFGYDPREYEIGRGVMEALGIGLSVQPDTDIAIRANFATLEDGKIVDRRAGRISTETNQRLVSRLKARIRQVDGVQVVLESGEEHRFVVILRGEGLDDRIHDADPGKTGEPPLPAEARLPEAERTAGIANRIIEMITDELADCHPANTALLRGFAKDPRLPSMKELFKLDAAAIAAYPMYLGIAQLVGMQVYHAGKDLSEEFDLLAERFSEHTFFYVHVKKSDSYGEDGKFDDKVKVIEMFDSLLPRALELKPDVVVVTGDHSTPAVLKSHSWHPSPFLLYSEDCRPDGVETFTEKECVDGGLGRFEAKYAMSLMLANAMKMDKFGA